MVYERLTRRPLVRHHPRKPLSVVIPEAAQRKSGTQYTPDVSLIERPPFTGSPAFAGDDGCG